MDKSHCKYEITHKSAQKESNWSSTAMSIAPGQQKGKKVESDWFVLKFDN